MTLAAQTGLGKLLAGNICIAEPRIKSGAANPAPKLATLVAGMCAGADSIDDVDIVRGGGMKTLFDGVYAPSTIGTLWHRCLDRRLLSCRGLVLAGGDQEPLGGRGDRHDPRGCLDCGVLPGRGA
jgi:hypothetical protein